MNLSKTASPANATDDAAPRRHGGSNALTVVVATLAAFTVLTAFLVAYALEFSALQEQRSQHQLYEAFRGRLSPASPDGPVVGGVIPPGTPVAMLDAPTAGIHELMVVEGTSSSDLLAGPGHLRDSPLPGQPGQSILMGKAVTAGAPFRSIANLHAGDPISVRTGQGLFRFTVVSVRGAGARLPQLPASGSLLTLVTTAGSGWLGGLRPNEVVYVDAALQGRAASAPSPRPEALPTDEVQGRGDPSAWPYVVFWTQALLVVACGAVWLAARWGRWQLWLIAAPIVFAVLWGLSTEAMRLLPNVF
jgi:sortase A